MKLSNEDVVMIRTMSGSAAEIASQFGVARSTVKSIRNGKTRRTPEYVRPEMASHVKGSDVFGAKLTAGDVLAIRSSTMSNAELAIQLGVSRQAIWSVRKGVTWKHVTNTLT